MAQGHERLGRERDPLSDRKERAMTLTMFAEIATVAVFVWGIITFRQDVRLRRADHFGRVRNDLV